MKQGDFEMTYPLEERIGQEELYVARQAVSAEFDQWIGRIPKKLSKSRAILARRKSGKTAFIQRLFNRLWSKNGEVIPFYIEISERNVWCPEFALQYFKTFASHYISFLERKPELVLHRLTLPAIRQYGERHGLELIVDDVESLESNFRDGLHDGMWEIAVTAPHRYASAYSKKVLVIIDEFQNLNGYIYLDRNKEKLDKTIPGSYHEWSESKVAPMLVTGSEVGWLINVIDTYLQLGRLSKQWWNPCLSQDEGLEAVYRYAAAYQEPVTNESALLLNQLTASDPYFIASVVRSQCPERDLTSVEGVTASVQFEVNHPYGELCKGWMDYFDNVLDRINQKNAKKILLLLTRHSQRTWTAAQIEDDLELGLDADEIGGRLKKLAKADLIEEYQDRTYQGYKDGTFHLIVQNMFRSEMEAMQMEPEGLAYRKRMLLEKNSLQGTLNELAGRFAELQLAYDLLARKTFSISDYFDGIADQPPFEVKELSQRNYVQNYQGGGEYDLVVDAEDERTLAVEVKKRKAKIGAEQVARFAAKIELLRAALPKRCIIPAYLALGGFSKKALALCREKGIGTASRLDYLQKKWSF